jgi:cob(I)alamin adenosyltransferase
MLNTRPETPFFADMKIYTKTGDGGSTSLFGGSRVPKSHLRIEAYGTIDELNAWIGLLRDQPVNENRADTLTEIQDRLFTLGSLLATEPGNTKVKTPPLRQQDVVFLEQQMDSMNEQLPPMRSFVLPGGHPSVSLCHIARTVCRRAERCVIALHQTEPVEPLIIQYINRLSDYLFVLARLMGRELQATEIPWKPRME